MKIKKFYDFVINENSDLDWSDKNWGEVDQDGRNPPNSGLEGTSAEPMDHSGGDYGETADSEDQIITSAESARVAASEIDLIAKLAKDLSNRIREIEKKCERYAKHK